MATEHDDADRDAASPAAAYDYSYDQDGAVGQSSAADQDGAAAQEGAVAGSGADDGDDAAAPTGVHTAMRGGTAPRAVLREVPAGFPTPPPRPARPNRAPARPASTTSGRSGGARRSLILGAAAFGAVLLLLLVAVGGFVAFRALSGEDRAPAASSGTSAPAEGAVTLGEISVREVSTQAGLERVGPQAKPLRPEGEFVVVTVEVENSSQAQVMATKPPFSLELADGTVVPADVEAGVQHDHEVDADRSLRVGAGETQQVFAVFDVPFGGQPKALKIDLSRVPGGGAGVLPLKG